MQRSGLRASHRPAVNQHDSSEAKPSQKTAYVTFPLHKSNQSGDQRLCVYASVNTKARGVEAWNASGLKSQIGAVIEKNIQLVIISHENGSQILIVALGNLSNTFLS